MKILALNPGSRYLGIAVFQGPDLRDWGTRSIKGKSLKGKLAMLRKVLSDLIDRYEPDVMTVKQLHPSRSSKSLEKLITEIINQGKRNGLKIYHYPLEVVENFFSFNGKINKRQMAELISREYPFLGHELEKEKSNLNPYHIRMFEAVALGLICLDHIENKNNTYEIQNIHIIFPYLSHWVFS